MPARNPGGDPPALPDQLETAEGRLLADFGTKSDLAAAFGVSLRTIERWTRLRIQQAPVRLGRVSLYHLPTIQAHLLRVASGRKSR